MDKSLNYIEINRQSWNNRTAHHLKSEFYDQGNFMKGNSSLNEIELNFLKDIKGKSVLHLQCHFGQDSISLSRLGAKVTGVDFSEKAIDAAKVISKELKINTEFICSDVYELPNILDKKFDVVYTSYGTIGWLPDLDKWAQVISHFLKPNGKLLFVEFHPVVWMYNDDFNKIAYRYFNSGAIIESENGTYTDRSADLAQEYVMWNHSLSEVITSLIRQNLTIKTFEEYDYSPYNCFNHTIEFEPKKFRIKHLENNIPMVYLIEAIQK